jgi:hypothetical protein
LLLIVSVTIRQLDQPVTVPDAFIGDSYRLVNVFAWEPLRKPQLRAASGLKGEPSEKQPAGPAIP